MTTRGAAQAPNSPAMQARLWKQLERTPLQSYLPAQHRCASELSLSCAALACIVFWHTHPAMGDSSSCNRARKLKYLGSEVSTLKTKNALSIGKRDALHGYERRSRYGNERSRSTNPGMTSNNGCAMPMDNNGKGQRSSLSEMLRQQLVARLLQRLAIERGKK